VIEDHKWALVVAHPGHELRAFHFLERATPRVSVLTDGSGSQGTSRLDATTRVLDEAGATRDTLYGCFTDKSAYAQLITLESMPFVAAAYQLSDTFTHHGITAVLTDAAEGYNPIHDLCHGIAEAGVRLCGALAPRLFELDLVGRPDASGVGIRLTLDDRAFAKKLDAVHRYTALTDEATDAFARHGQEAFRIEFLRQAAIGGLRPATHVPYYEQIGDERVRQGRYNSVLRYSTHVRPLLATLHALGQRPPSVESHASPDAAHQS